MPVEWSTLRNERVAAWIVWFPWAVHVQVRLPMCHITLQMYKKRATKQADQSKLSEDEFTLEA